MPDDGLAGAAAAILTATRDPYERYWFTAWINDATHVCNHCLAPLDADPHGEAEPAFRAEEHLEFCVFRKLDNALRQAVGAAIRP